jgi:hypothetical protein
MKVRQQMNRITNNTQIIVIIVHMRQISKTTTTLIIRHSQQQPDQRDEVAVDQQQQLLQLERQVLEQQALQLNEAKEQAQLNEQPQRVIIGRGRHCRETRQQQQRRQRHKDGVKVKRTQEHRRQQYTLAIQQKPAALEPH